MKTIFVRALLALTLVSSIGLQATNIETTFKQNFTTCKRDCPPTVSKKNIGIAPSHLKDVSHAITCQAYELPDTPSGYLNYKEASGIVGERAICRFFEQGNYLCYSSFMERNAKKCCPGYEELCRTTYNKRNGVDNIFVPVDRSGKRDTSRPLVILEAKYDKNCKLSLRNTSCMCDQMSHDWVSQSLNKLLNRILQTHKNAVRRNNRLKKKCAEIAFGVVYDIKAEFTADKVIRIAAVLCPDSKICLYLIHDHGKRTSAGKLHRTAIAELVSNLPPVETRRA